MQLQGINLRNLNHLKLLKLIPQRELFTTQFQKPELDNVPILFINHWKKKLGRGNKQLRKLRNTQWVSEQTLHREDERLRRGGGGHTLLQQL